MKSIKLLVLVLGLFFLGCTHDIKSGSSTKNKLRKVDSPDTHVDASKTNNDKEEIQALIRGMLIWTVSKNETKSRVSHFFSTNNCY